LRAVYFVVVSLALREALNRTFLEDNDFIGLHLVDHRHLPTTLLFAAFVPTAIRFVHGASIHIDLLSDNRYKPLVDFCGFLIQSALLYLMAVTLHEPTDFVTLFVLMLMFDVLWLFALHATDYHRVDQTERQWLVSNTLLAIVLLAALAGGVEWSATLGIWFACTIATVLDYKMNRTFYFPNAHS